MLSIFRTKRGKAIVGGIGGVGIVGGAAVAAVLLTTSISGNTGVVIDSGGSGPDAEFAVSIAAENGDRLICDGDNGDGDALVLSADGTTLSLNPVVRKPAGDPPAEPTSIEGASCTITVTVDNTGEVPVKISDAALTLPQGWTISPLTGDARNFVPAGGEASASAVLTARTDAAEGALTGSLTYADNSPES